MSLDPFNDMIQAYDVLVPPYSLSPPLPLVFLCYRQLVYNASSNSSLAHTSVFGIDQQRIRTMADRKPALEIKLPAPR